MISASEWKAYNDGVAEISDTAEREVVNRLRAWHAECPAASVAETREYAKLVMAELVGSSDSLASSFAAKWYDHRAGREGARLKQAVTAAVYAPETTDEVARYQAKKLADGDFEGFAKACGEYARNDVLRSLNETILANAERDAKHGVRFARVPTGYETCTFCLMLASRGAVYSTRQTAGEFRHFHRGCDCKVVPGFMCDPDAELVEGCKPEVLRRQWKRIEAARKKRTKGLDLTGRIDEYQENIERAWKEYVALGKSTEAYERTIGKYIRSLVSGNPISVEPHTKLAGKEVMAAVRLAADGHAVVLRNADEHLRSDGNTSDALVDGSLCDFKKVTSPRIKKLVRELTGKLDRQGPGFLVDISESKITLEEAEVRVSSLLDDPGIRVVYVLKGKVMERINK